jgi:hypothetical protein
MSTRRWRRALVTIVLLGTLGAWFLSAQGATGVTRATAAAPNLVNGDTPAPVAHGKANALGRHNGGAVFQINVGLAVRDSSGLDQLISDASTPGNPQYGHFLTNAQYMARYAPTDGDVQAVTQWLTGQGLTVLGVSPDNLLVKVRGKVNQLEKAFGVQINDYEANGRKFHSNDRDPTYPAGLNVQWISGLSNYDVFKAFDTCTPTNVCSYDGGDLRRGYDVAGDASGQTLGFTLWGDELPQSDYTGYANATGTTPITVGGAGDNGLDFQQVDGAGSETDTDPEVALDTENAHLVAPGAHLTYWLGSDNSNSTLEDVLNTAANSPSSIKVISNSWGSQANPCSVDGGMESSLQHGAAVGKTFYFSSGDAPASSGCSYPAVSQYVVAVGGTNLQLTDPGDVYTSEAGVDDGGGCLNSEPRPSWQTGIGTALTWPSSTCTGRAEPDVSAITGFCSDGTNCGPGTYLYFDGSPSCCWGGTSLSAPVWAAASVVWNKNNAGSGRPGIGFSAPLIYALANDPTTYARDFHDVTSGGNGFNAGTGWDESTGWGSADFDKLMNNVADVTYTGPTSANHGDSITLSGKLLDHGASTPLATGALGTLQLSFAADGSNCDANVDGSGNASCAITVSSAPGTYKAIAAYAGDAAYKGGSDTVDFIVNHIPTKLTYTGATSGDYNDAVTMSAKLIDNSNGTSFSSGDPLKGEKLVFTLGGESCSGTTDSSGVATCSLTPLDDPGPYSAGVSFAGDEPMYEPSSASSSFTLKQEESSLSYSGPLTVDYHDVFTAKAKLIDPDGGAGIPNKTVSFKLGATDSCSGTTDSGGNVSCTITPSQTGTQTLVASFGPDTDYVSSSDPHSFSITPEETTMAYTGPTVILAGASGATLTATLVEDGSNDNDGDGGSAAPNPAETVTLSIGSQSCTGTTDSAGKVSCSISSVTVPLGPETVKAALAGDAFYVGSSDSKTAIVFAFPSSGVFTLGDNSAVPSTTVNWWNQNWNLVNSLSGGAAPPAFKGFLATVTLPSTTPANLCTSNWTTSGGNSPPPPATVPAYMGVVVSSKITKTGNNLNGNYMKIVVVQTNPGYAPGPVNSGTGTIVATFCP